MLIMKYSNCSHTSEEALWLTDFVLKIAGISIRATNSSVYRKKLLHVIRKQNSQILQAFYSFYANILYLEQYFCVLNRGSGVGPTLLELEKSQNANINGGWDMAKNVIKRQWFPVTNLYQAKIAKFT